MENVTRLLLLSLLSASCNNDDDFKQPLPDFEKAEVLLWHRGYGDESMYYDSMLMYKSDEFLLVTKHLDELVYKQQFEILEKDADGLIRSMKYYITFYDLIDSGVDTRFNDVNYMTFALNSDKDNILMIMYKPIK